jgi:single-stranded-DNA-specific exonuclease
LVFVAAEGWHPGVIGIVAARLKERYERPACVVAIADGTGKGSGRSVPG